MTTITVKTKRKPDTYYKTHAMRVEGGWVGVHTRSRAAARATVRLFLTNVPSRAPHTEHCNGPWDSAGSASTTSPTPRGDGDQFFLRRNLPTSRLVASVGFACA